MKNFSYVIIILITFACTDGNVNSSDLTYTLPDSASMDTYYLENYKYFPIKNNSIQGGIVDVATNQNECYVLDRNNNITKISLTDGSILSTMNRIGHAKGELISPKCICADNQYLYVFDNGRSSIEVFDKNLSYMKRIPAGSFVSEILKIDNGFLCYNRYGQEVSYMDDHGKILYSKQLTESSNRQISYGCKAMKESADHQIYVKGECSDSIFKWNGRTIEPYCHVIYSENSKRTSENKVFTVDFLPLNNRIVICYLRGIYFNYVLCSRNSIKHIMAKNFFYTPRWNAGNTHIEIDEIDACEPFINFTKQQKRSSEYLLIKYDMNSIK